MLKLLSWLGVISLVLGGTSVFAQTPPVSGPVAPLAPPPLETPPPAAQAPIPEVKATKFGDWYLRCVEGADAAQKQGAQCEVAQIAQVKDQGQDVQILTVAFSRVTVPADAKTKKPETKSIMMTTIVPLNMYLPAGFSFLDGTKELRKLSYRNCNQAGCWTQSTVDAKFLTAFSAAKDMIARMQLMTGQNINLKFSVNGLPQALEELNKANP